MNEPVPSSTRPTALLSRQRRGSRRRPLEATVQVVAPEAGRGVTINVSDGGLRVAVDCSLIPGETCLMVLREAGRPEALVRGRVAWARQLAGDGCIAGLERLGLH
ncbi:MAG: PilZ domain-containing protein [Myxococcota bacterium]